jgi:hypothetical protein
MSDSLPVSVVRVNENVAHPDSSSQSASAIAASSMERRRSGRWFAAFCALLALTAAGIALAAPGLRPRVGAAADRWLGAGNAVSLLLTPSAAIEAGWRGAREEAMQALSARLGDITARLDRLDTAQQATAADITRTVAELRADRATGETLSRATDVLSRQIEDLRATTTAIEARARAAGLLALALRLRRDIDAGLPIDRDVATMAAGGPYPGAINRALQQLQAISDGAPTMRDLADEFDRVIARIAARSGSGTTWANTGWSRFTALFGGGAPLENPGLIEHMRALAMNGRFSEAASELEKSDEGDIGADWAARVRERATAVSASQALLAYSLAAYDNAFAIAGTQ